MSTLSGKPLKLVDQFIYLNSYISSNENDVNICLGKVWNTIDRLSILWKSHLSYKIKCSCVHIMIRMHLMDALKSY